MGALVGAGLASPGGGVQLAALGGDFVRPLLVSPVLALAATGAIYPVFRSGRRRLRLEPSSCVFVGVAPSVETPAVCAAVVPALEATVGPLESCPPGAASVDARSALDVLHVLSGGAVCFARALNDTPKIAALLAAGEWPRRSPGRSRP